MVAATSATKSERSVQNTKTFVHFKDICYSASQESRINNSEERQFNIYDRVQLLWSVADALERNTEFRSMHQGKNTASSSTGLGINRKTPLKNSVRVSSNSNVQEIALREVPSARINPKFRGTNPKARSFGKRHNTFNQRKQDQEKSTSLKLLNQVIWESTTNSSAKALFGVSKKEERQTIEKYRGVFGKYEFETFSKKLHEIDDRRSFNLRMQRRSNGPRNESSMNRKHGYTRGQT